MPSGPPIRLSTDVCVLSTQRSLQPGRFTNIYFISATHQLYVVTCSRVRVSSSTPRIQTTVKSKSITPTTTISCGAANTERATGGERWNWRNCCVPEAAQTGGLAGLAGARAGRRGGHRDAATCGVLERPGKLLDDSGAQAADELPAFTAAWLPGRRYPPRPWSFPGPEVSFGSLAPRPSPRAPGRRSRPVGRWERPPQGAGKRRSAAGPAPRGRPDSPVPAPCASPVLALLHLFFL